MDANILNKILTHGMSSVLKNNIQWLTRIYMPEMAASQKIYQYKGL